MRVGFCNGLRFLSTDRRSLTFDSSEIRSIQKEEQRQFWLAITDMNGAQSANHWEVQIQTFEDTKEYYSEGGEYLPLTVWATRGFDADRIERASRDTDVIEDPVLGTVYRVRILQKGNSGCRTTLTTKNLKRKPQQMALGAGSSGDGGFTVGGDGPPLNTPPPMAALEDGSPGGHSSSSSGDDSSSSSSSSDKKKKSKKQKGQEKQQGQ